MSTATAPAETLTDAQFELADTLTEVLDAAGHTTTFTPSQLARKVKADTAAIYPVITWLVDNTFAAVTGNGAWRRYSARRPLRIGTPDQIGA